MVTNDYGEDYDHCQHQSRLYNEYDDYDPDAEYCVHCECCCTCQACEYADRTDSTVYPAGPYGLVDAGVIVVPGPDVAELGSIGDTIIVRFGGDGDAYAARPV